jgi:hypothetical protein
MFGGYASQLLFQHRLQFVYLVLDELHLVFSEPPLARAMLCDGPPKGGSQQATVLENRYRTVLPQNFLGHQDSLLH